MMSKYWYRRLLFVCLGCVLALIGYFSFEYFNENAVSQVIQFEDVVPAKIQVGNAAEKYDGQNYTDDTTLVSGDKRTYVIPCGNPIGIYVKSKGVMVVSPTPVKDLNNNACSPCSGKLYEGDNILSINGNEVNDKKQMNSYIARSDGEAITMKVYRDGKSVDVTVTPVETKKGYMLGLWVKDDISGIGTLTYVSEDGFGALGHSINDNDTGKLFVVGDGAIYKANLIDILKPKKNSPGRIEGMIDYSSDNIIGRILSNDEAGIRGYINEAGLKIINDREWVQVAKKDEIHTGRAYIKSSITGKDEYYEIEIAKINISAESYGKELEIKVEDERLLAYTGGIVQGMSGSPVLQNGRIVGAVTHVLVNDPTRGYGIFIENMLEN